MSRIDHLVVAVDDVPSAVAQWRARTGITFVRAGRHPAGTENALAVLCTQDFYVELIAVYDPSSPSAWTRRAVEVRGPMAWALSVVDLDESVAAVRASGVTVSTPEDGSRECPDGTLVRWRSAYLGQEPGDQGWPFLLEWPMGGPERLGIGATTDHRVTGLSVAVPDPEWAAVVLSAALGLRRVDGCAHDLTDGVMRLNLVAAAESHAPLALAVDGLAQPLELDGLRLDQSVGVGQRHAVTTGGGKS